MSVITKKEIPSYLRDFSKAQLAVILGEEKTKQVVAAAGSGKTRTIIGLLEYRLREKLEHSERILLLSFSRKAVEELRERLSFGLGKAIEVSTFHSFCLRHLQELYPRALKNIQILTEEKKADFYYEFLSQKHILQEIGGIPIPLLCQEKDSFATLFPEIHSSFQIAYQEYKRDHHLFEFEDLVEIMLKKLRKKTRVFSELAKLYDLVIVDEFQDTDPSQLDFLLLLPVTQRVVVGDDWQAIYAFRGASLKPFIDFQTLFSAKVLRLCDNYRSLKNIVHLGSRIISASSQQIHKRVHAIRASGDHFPILGIKLERDDPFSLVELLQKKVDSNFRILVRTNWRRDYWLKLGIEEEKVMTIHKSKGLEFPLVFLDICSGWTRGINKKKSHLQNIFKKDKNSMLWIDEEIRILYVGASRAMNLLVVLHFPIESTGERERFYYEKLIAPKVKAITVKETGMWIDKERLFRTSSSN